ncbi:MAG TPA: type VI secretion system protein TssA [Pyrinomonadaceae bacterium]|jgi:type VI secretion system ImpA family protein
MSVLAFPKKIDIHGLLEPIAGSNRAGESLRYQGTYDRIAEARRQDDARLSQGIYKSTLKRADWSTVESICIEALTTRTKDLQIAGWLLEAWLHLYGFSGVARGLRLLDGLCTEFWDDAYPSLDGGDLDGRVAPFAWIEEKLSLNLKQIPLTLPRNEAGAESYSYVDWESACHYENLAIKDPRAFQETLAKLNPTVDAFRKAVAATDRSFYEGLVAGLDEAIDACELLQHDLDQNCGKAAPSFHQFKEALGAIQQLVYQDLHSRDDSSETPNEESVPAETSDSEVELWSSGPVRNRNDAYRRLSEVADYLLRTEPHSPTPYLVRRAVEWGNMSLPELLQQIVRNQGELDEIDKLLGLTGQKWPTLLKHSSDARNF